MSVCTGTKALALLNGANANTPVTKAPTTRSLRMRNRLQTPCGRTRQVPRESSARRGTLPSSRTLITGGAWERTNDPNPSPRLLHRGNCYCVGFTLRLRGCEARRWRWAARRRASRWRSASWWWRPARRRTARWRNSHRRAAWWRSAFRHAACSGGTRVACTTRTRCAADPGRPASLPRPRDDRAARGPRTCCGARVQSQRSLPTGHQP